MFTLLYSVLILTLFASCSRQEANNNIERSDSVTAITLTENQKKVLAGTKKCLEAAFEYDNEMAYHVLKYREGEYIGSPVYPNGDLDASLGVCTDVTIRALRWGGVCDLQKEIHEDIKANWGDYPMSRWGAKKPDANIDHRRVPNQLVWFKKNWYEVKPPSPQAEEPGVREYLPGDVVVWDMNEDGWADHIGIISDAPLPQRVTDSDESRTKEEGVHYKVIHNFPSPGYVAEEDVLNRWKIAGVFRVK